MEPTPAETHRMNIKNLYTTKENCDCSVYYSMPVLKYFYLKRPRMIIDLIEDGGKNVLDAGCGSGILFYELRKKFSNLNGIDLRKDIKNIERALEKDGIRANLINGDLSNLPYKNDTFDYVVSMSVLEHIPDLEQPVKEIKRVLKKGGTAIIGFPVKNFIMRQFFKIIKFDDEKGHPSDHNKIYNTLNRNFNIEKMIKFPRFLKAGHSLYIVCKCKNKL